MYVHGFSTKEQVAMEFNLMLNILSYKRYDLITISQNWAEQIKQHAAPDVNLMIVGNKTDLASERVGLVMGRRFGTYFKAHTDGAVRA
jgi:GTPase SAR1 family protein